MKVTTTESTSPRGGLSEEQLAQARQLARGTRQQRWLRELLGEQGGMRPLEQMGQRYGAAHTRDAFRFLSSLLQLGYHLQPGAGASRWRMLGFDAICGRLLAAAAEGPGGGIYDAFDHAEWAEVIREWLAARPSREAIDIAHEMLVRLNKRNVDPELIGRTLLAAEGVAA